MRLVNTKKIELESFITVDEAPPYAILSHTWETDEVSFVELSQSRSKAEEKAGFGKIRSLCSQALQDGLEYAWIDTVCIDQSSSAELSEAINSMNFWYAFPSLEDVRIVRSNHNQLAGINAPLFATFISGISQHMVCP